MALSILALALSLAENPQVPEASQTQLRTVIENPSAELQVDFTAGSLAEDQLAAGEPWANYSQAGWNESWSQGGSNWHNVSYSQSGWFQSWPQSYDSPSPGAEEGDTAVPLFSELELSSQERTALEDAGLI